MTSQTRCGLHPLDIGEVFGQVIQELRRQRGFSQEELGSASGLHRTYISLLERGKKSPTLTSLFRLATALNTQPSEIARRVESGLGWSIAKNVD